MRTREWQYVDKSKWDAGEWQQEPDKKQWVDGNTGLPCLIVRGPSGALCGYVGVSASHPWHGIDYASCTLREAAPRGLDVGIEPEEATWWQKHQAAQLACSEEWCSHHPGSIISVHGGLTFAAKCQPSTDNHEHGICHIVDDGEDGDVWWFGFDCAHAGDYEPKDAELRERLGRSFARNWDDHYRNIRYVESECADLARQLAEVKR